jgi:hypothetical protein
MIRFWDDITHFFAAEPRVAQHQSSYIESQSCEPTAAESGENQQQSRLLCRTTTSICKRLQQAFGGFTAQAVRLELSAEEW